MEPKVNLDKGLRWCSAVSDETGNENAERWMQPISVSKIQDFDATTEMDHVLQHFLDSG